jgi:hypothetical protein
MILAAGVALLGTAALTYWKLKPASNKQLMPSTLDEAQRICPNLDKLTPAQRVRFAFRLNETNLLFACLHGRVSKGSVRVLRHWHKETGSQTWELASLEVTPTLNGAPTPPGAELELIRGCLNRDLVGQKRSVDDSDGPLPGSFETDLVVADGGLLEMHKSSQQVAALQQITWAGEHSFPTETDPVYDDLARFKP